jgi:hypothetical protein
MRSKWILLSSLLLVLAILGPACSRQGNGNSGTTATAQGGSDDPGGSVTGSRVDGATEPHPPGGPMNFEKAAVTNVLELFHTNNPTAFWTRPVDLSGVTVQQIFADGHFIVVGPDKDHTLPVQMGELHREIKVGQKIDIVGVIDPIGRDKTQWNVQLEEQKVLAQHSIFIQARSIKPSPQ